jgi:hypothetical protein
LGGEVVLGGVFGGVLGVLVGLPVASWAHPEIEQARTIAKQEKRILEEKGIILTIIFTSAGYYNLLEKSYKSLIFLS